MTERYPNLYRSLRGFGLAAVLLGPVLAGWSATWIQIGVVAAILLVGLPHGATDYLIFKYLTRPFWGTRSLRVFFARYILLMAAYALVWWLAPTLALLLFLVLSMYHFGQSNWNYVERLPARLAAATNMWWGAFVVLAPVLGHYDETAPIIEAIIGTEAPAIPLTVRLVVLGILLGGCVLLPGILRRRGYLDVRQRNDEWINLGVLAAVFAATPGLVGFAIYFVGWHSLTSIQDQVAFFRQRRGAYSVRHYARDTLPLTAAALAGLALLVAGERMIGAGLGIGALFVFIAVVTLPHMLLLDRLYEDLAGEGGPQDPLMP